jgi:hypothetical protein
LKIILTENQSKLQGSETPPFSEYFSDDEFSAEKALPRLLSGHALVRGEARLLLTGLMCWIIAPDQPDYARWKLLHAATSGLRVEKRRIAKKASDKVPSSGLDLLLQHDPRAKWLYAALEILGGWAMAERAPTRDRMRDLTHRLARYAAYTGDIISSVHLHIDQISQERSRYGPVSVKKAIAVVEKLLELQSKTMLGSQIHAVGKEPKKAETLRSEVWSPRRASAAWCYAASEMTVGKGSLVEHFAKFGRFPKGFQDGPDLIVLASMAKYVQEKLFIQLRADSREALPSFNFPASAAPVAFPCRTYSPSELPAIRKVSIDDRWAGGL